MTTYLLDVNVLIALIDPGHVQHNAAHAWFSKEGRRSWATCPLTENGVLRIVGNPRYPNSPGVPAAVAQIMTEFCGLRGHVFWPDDISLINGDACIASRLLISGQVTDTYLLALAHAHEGRLATFDRRLVADAVRDGARTLQVIG
ncbi:MAG TPA: TA system VapC family ribonuclease toxin [Rhizomicrobium sp.]